MATINGDVQKRVTLVANEDTVIQFSDTIQSYSIHATGGSVYFKIGSVITGTTDLTTNILPDGDSFTGYKERGFLEVHLFSTTEATVQWDTPRMEG